MKTKGKTEPKEVLASRVPKSLRRSLAKLAKAQRIRLSEYVCDVLREHVANHPNADRSAA